MSDMAVDYKLRAFSVREYHRMAEIGLLLPKERVELLDGAIVEMSPIGGRHWNAHARIVEYLVQAFGNDALVVGQMSLPLGDHNEPQPDIAILARRDYAPPNAELSVAEVNGIIELAESSLRLDLGVKLRLYARHAIADYLVVDLTDNVLLHHRDPHELGYRTVRRLTGTDSFALTSLPKHQLRVAPFLAQKP